LISSLIRYICAFFFSESTSWKRVWNIHIYIFGDDICIKHCYLKKVLALQFSILLLVLSYL